MRFKWTEPDGYVSGGFTSENDPFGRQDLAKRLTNLFVNLEHGSVVLLDGRWGSGKTTFARTWTAQLQKDGFPCVYMDAFACDYLRDGFTAVAASLTEAVRAVSSDNDARYRRFLSSATAVGKRLLIAGARVGAKAATLGALGEKELEAFGGVLEDTTDALGELAEEQVKKALLDNEDAKASFARLRKSLEELPALMRSGDAEGVERPLIVIVDELDRCRPDFALDVLESLKHCFQADRVHFVLITHQEHLQRSVEQRYGAGKYAREYLQKFYDFVVDFGAPVSHSSRAWREQFIRGRLLHLIPVAERSEFVSGMLDMLVDLSVAYDFSIREIEAALTITAMAALSTNANELRPAVLVSTLTLLKLRYPPMFAKAKLGQLTWADMKAVLEHGHWPDGYNDRIGKVIQFYTDPSINVNEAQWENFKSMTWRYNISDTDVVGFLARSVVERFARS